MKRTAILVCLALLAFGTLLYAGEQTKEWSRSSTHSTTKTTMNGNTMTQTTNSTTKGSSVSVTTPDASTAGAIAAGAALGAILSGQQNQQPAQAQPAAPAPAAAAAASQPAAPQGDVVVNVPLADGSMRPVTLQRANPGFIGPQNEYYPILPDATALRQRYGR